MRRTFLWLAFGSLLAVACIYTTSLALRIVFLRGGVYSPTPYGSGFPSYIRILNTIGYVQAVLVPIAAVSSAIYMLLLDRDFRTRTQPKGFEVQMGAQPRRS